MKNNICGRYEGEWKRGFASAPASLSPRWLLPAFATCAHWSRTEIRIETNVKICKTNTQLSALRGCTHWWNTFLLETWWIHQIRGDSPSRSPSWSLSKSRQLGTILDKTIFFARTRGGGLIWQKIGTMWQHHHCIDRMMHCLTIDFTPGNWPQGLAITPSQ